MIKIKVKKLSKTAVMPKRMHIGDAGFDLTSASCKIDKKHHLAEVHGTGLAFEIPEGYAMFIFPRSSSYKNQALMSNCVGVIDSNYRGEVHVIFTKPTDYIVGDRIAQAVILPYPQVEYEEVDELQETERGTNGLGSTGK